MTEFIKNLTPEQVRSWGKLFTTGTTTRSYQLYTGTLVEYESIKTYDMSRRMKRSVCEVVTSDERLEAIKKEVSESGKYGKMTILAENENFVIEYVSDYKGEYGRENYIFGDSLIELCENVTIAENIAMEQDEADDDYTASQIAEEDCE